MTYSPLRYPGGKNRLAKFISRICVDNNISGHYVEPYAGGASVALYLLLEGKVSKITINDIDRSIYAFWHSVLKNTNKLCQLIELTEINLESWRKAKDIQKNKDKADLLELGFSTLFLNRTNRSGIMRAGVIGGLSQAGRYKIDCRFNKQEIIKRIRNIAKYKKCISLYRLDAIDLIKKIKKEAKQEKTIFYFDPPYYIKGESLYLNYYEHSDHERVSSLIKSIKNIHWIVSYDNVHEIKRLYQGFKRKEYSFLHTAFRAKEGKEILFFSKDLLVPRIADPTRI